ncbi:MAG: 6-phosphofructokinase [Deltaproteobacteria bacterium]|nr:6-phosphofructokinase [Deltaproteobacteria bacterium]
MVRSIVRIGVLTGGGDAPGMNAALKALVYRASECNAEVVGLYDGWEGLLGSTPPEVLALDRARVRLWDREAGSNLGCTRTNPFRVERGDRREDCSREILSNINTLGLDALVVIGGRDTLGAAQRMHTLGVPIVVVPKSIDLEVGATDYAIGFDSALRNCTEIIANSRSSAGARRWVQVVEVVGRRAGHLALWGGLAGGAQMILLPELPFSLEKVYALLDARLSVERGRSGRNPRYATVVVAEGACAEGMHEVLVDAAPDAYGASQLGGVGALLAERLRQDMGVDARSVALGHPLRGGVPTSLDRVMAHRLASAAVDACRVGAFGQMVSAVSTLPYGTVRYVPLPDVLAAPCNVNIARDYDSDRYFAQRALAP